MLRTEKTCNDGVDAHEGFHDDSKAPTSYLAIQTGWQGSTQKRTYKSIFYSERLRYGLRGSCLETGLKLEELESVRND